MSIVNGLSVLDKAKMGSLIDNGSNERKPVAVASIRNGPENILKAFTAPWLFCRFGFGDRFLDYLARNADVVGRKNLLKNKNLSSKLIHKIIVGNYGFYAIEFNDLSSHPNISDSDVAYLLLDEKISFGVQYYSSNYARGLHFLRDSGSEADYEAYCLLALTGATMLDRQVSKLDGEDIHALLNGKGHNTQGDGYDAFGWRRRSLIVSILDNDNRFDILYEVMICADATREQRETAYAFVKDSPEFQFADMPDNWARRASGMLPEVEGSNLDKNGRLF